MKLERDKAFFPGSRLYRQAGEIADHLLLEMKFPVPLSEAVTCLRGEGLELAFRPGELDRPIEVVRAAIERSIDSISPYHAVPALIRAVASFDRPRPAATAAVKVLTIRLQRRVWTDAPGLSPSPDSLVRAARLVYAERLFKTVRTAWAVRPDGHAEITPEGMTFDPDTGHLLRAGAQAMSGGGTLLRFSGETTRRMYDDPVAFLLNVCAVLAGDPPATRRTFAGTFLPRLPGADVAREYWAALAARLLLLETARRVTRPIHDDPRGIAILGLSSGEIYGPAAERLTGRDLSLLQREINACFWNRRWLTDVLSREEESYAFVGRPICRIDRDRPLFVTSARNIADSITALTETAIGPYPGNRPHALPDAVFERLLSKRFEADVVRLLRDHGFVAGEVTSKGTWLTQGGPIESPPGLPQPKGQIDLLAWHPTGYMILGDCKILQFPFSERAWVNLWKTLHEDVRGFHGKLQANAEWAREFLSATGRPAGRSDIALILDQPLHLWYQNGTVTVTDYPDLAGKLERGTIPG
jgi:hypothetical protein